MQVKTNFLGIEETIEVTEEQIFSIDLPAALEVFAQPKYGAHARQGMPRMAWRFGIASPPGQASAIHVKLGIFFQVPERRSGQRGNSLDAVCAPAVERRLVVPTTAPDDQELGGHGTGAPVTASTHCDIEAWRKSSAVCVTVVNVECVSSTGAIQGRRATLCCPRACRGTIDLVVSLRARALCRDGGRLMARALQFRS